MRVPSIWQPPQMPRTRTADRPITSAIPLARSQAEVGDDVLGAGQHDEVGAPQVTLVLGERDPGGPAEQVQLIEVGAVREAGDGDAERAAAGIGAHRGPLLVGELVAQHRHDAGARHARQLGQPLRTGRQQLDVAAEAVEDVAAEPLTGRRRAPVAHVP